MCLDNVLQAADAEVVDAHKLDVGVLCYVLGSCRVKRGIARRKLLLEHQPPAKSATHSSVHGRTKLLMGYAAPAAAHQPIVRALHYNNSISCATLRAWLALAGVS
jgi:hypothetical protein